MTAPAATIGDSRVAGQSRRRTWPTVGGVVGRLLDLVLLALFVASVALIALTVVLPRTGHRLLVVRSGSMAPLIPTGSLVITGPLDPAGPQPGDIVSMRMESGVLVTHRVTRVFDLLGVPYVATQGDANEHEDATATPVERITGRAIAWFPGAGRTVAFIQSPVGRIAYLLGLVTLIALRYFWDDLFPAPAPAAAREPDSPTTSSARRRSRSRSVPEA